MDRARRRHGHREYAHAVAEPADTDRRWLPLVYAFTKEGWLCCLRAASGKSVWKLNYPSEFGTKQPIFGYCDRPLVDGDKLICVPGGPQATIVALDKLNGDVIWKTTVDSREQVGVRLDDCR